MKLAILFALVALGACGTLKTTISPRDLTAKYIKLGFKFDAYEVQTEDGYILELFRFYKEQKPSEGNKPAVLLMHALMTDCNEYLVGSYEGSLIYALAVEGYDVYFGNVRGTTFGRRHTSLNPDKDAAFWKFCWDDMGVKDLPAIVDKVLSVSGQNKLSYIGHNEATTYFYVMTSELPEYNNKFDKMISLGPIAYMKYSDNELLEKISGHTKEKSWVMKNIGMSTFNPSKSFLQDVEDKCVNENFEGYICGNPFFLYNGYDSTNFNQTTIKELLPVIPSTVSVREILHYAQLKSTGRFEKFDDGSLTEPKEYDLTKITTPIAVFYTPHDKLSNVQDVKYLLSKLPNTMTPVLFDKFTNNLDLLFAKDVKPVHDAVFDILKNEPKIVKQH